MQDFFRDEKSLVLGYHGGTHRTAECIFDLQAVGFTTEKYADARVFVGAFDITIKGFKVELELTKSRVKGQVPDSLVIRILFKRPFIKVSILFFFNDTWFVDYI